MDSWTHPVGTVPFYWFWSTTEKAEAGEGAGEEEDEDALDSMFASKKKKKKDKKGTCVRGGIVAVPFTAVAPVCPCHVFTHSRNPHQTHTRH